jgi:hypothetical protein
MSHWATALYGGICALVWAYGRTITWDYVARQAITGAVVLLMALGIRGIWRRIRRQPARTEGGVPSMKRAG